MLGIGFSRALAAGGFQHRSTPAPGGRVVYRLADGSAHITLGAEEWEAYGERFHAEAKPVVRRAFWLLAGLLPATFLFGMTIGQLLPGAGILIVAAVLLGPFAIYLWQSYRVRGIARRIEAELACRPRVAAPPPVPWRVPRALEIAALVLIGPHLIIQVYGSFFPDAFRNTPWTGTHLDWSGVAGFAVLAALLYFRRRGAVREAPAPDEPEERPAGRRLDAIARARRDPV